MKLFFIFLLICTAGYTSNFEITELRINKKYVRNNESHTYPLSFFKNSILKFEGKVYSNNLDKVTISVNARDFEAIHYGTDDWGYTEFELDYIVGNESVYVVVIHAEDTDGMLSSFFTYTINIEKNELKQAPVIRKITVDGNHVKASGEIFLRRQKIVSNINIQGEIEDISKSELDEIVVKTSGEKTAKFWSSYSNPFVYEFRFPLNLIKDRKVYDVTVYAVNKKKLKSREFSFTIIIKD